MESKIEKWKFLRYNIYGRNLFLTAYIIAKIQYQIIAFTIPGRYLRKMNILMYKYIWRSKKGNLIRSADKWGHYTNISV